MAALEFRSLAGRRLRLDEWGCETQIGWWTIVDGVVTWGGIIPGLLATSKVSLAAFNGYLYMASAYSKFPTKTFLSRFDPATKTWSFRGATGLPSVGGPPAIAAYNNKLYLIGTTAFPHAMWYATMDAHENFTSQQALPGHDSASRPSATVAFNKLWFAHRWGSTGGIVYGTFDGTTWSGANHIYGDINNGPPPTCGVAGGVGQPPSAAGMIGPSASVSATAN